MLLKKPFANRFARLAVLLACAYQSPKVASLSKIALGKLKYLQVAMHRLEPLSMGKTKRRS